MKNKKSVFAFCQIYENDSLKEYLEDMAMKGWQLTKMGSMFLHFEACEPHPIRYCVEIMDKASAYASNQTSALKQYREFCREAGWDYIGTGGMIHIFRTEDLDAVPVETDPQERYERICRASRGTCLTLIPIFLFLSLINLHICWQNGTIFCPQGFIVLLLVTACVFYLAGYLLWKRSAGISLDRTGNLPCAPWPAVRRRNYLFLGLVIFFCAAYLTASTLTGPGGPSGRSLIVSLLLLFLLVYGLIFYICSRLIYWLREKHTFSKSVNILIYWGISLSLCLAVILITGIIVFRFMIG